MLSHPSSSSSIACTCSYLVKCTPLSTPSPSRTPPTRQDRKQRDNILPKLLASSSKDPEPLFKAELAKYDDLVAEIDQNVRRQEQLLAAISGAQAKFKEDYGYVDWRRACNVCEEGRSAGLIAVIAFCYCRCGVALYVVTAELSTESCQAWGIFFLQLSQLLPL